MGLCRERESVCVCIYICIYIYFNLNAWVINSMTCGSIRGQISRGKKNLQVRENTR